MVYGIFQLLWDRKIYIPAEEIVILILIFHIFSSISRAFATMTKPYTSQSYMNGNTDCKTFISWSNMQIILFFLFMNINEKLENKGEIIIKHDK